MTRRRVVLGLSAVTVLVVLAVVAAASVTVWSVRRPFPDYAGSAEVPRLTANVEVIRDDYGIPHIYADTAGDLFRAQAYVHAQDRFWQMDLRRHVTAGRLSELFGEDQLETDTFVRTLGWADVARRELPLLSPETHRYLDAYADGVNAWMADRAGGELGLAYTLLGLTGGDDTPEKWTPVDSLSWLKAMAWDLRGNLEDEMARALLSEHLPIEQIEQLYPAPSVQVAAPIVGDQQSWAASLATIVEHDGGPVAVSGTLPSALERTATALGSAPVTLGAGDGIGSNSWVISGDHTESGAPLLANDPHLDPGVPSIWYQVGLHCRVVGPACPFDVVGYSFAGLPGVIIGHNRDVAWGFTNLNPDVSDLYLEQVRDDDTYLSGDEWLPMQVRKETIEVAGGEDVTITVRSTGHGPLLSDHDGDTREVGETAPVTLADQPSPSARGGGYGVALRWTALDPGRTADAIFALNRAHNWDSFRAAAALFEVPSQNLVYADVQGNIGYQAPGKIPVRRSGDGRYPVPGWTGEYDWAGYIPFEDLPHVFNPAEGFVVTANQPVTGPAYPFLLTEDFAPGYRAGRIQELIAEEIGTGDPLDVAAMTGIQMDTRNAMAKTLVPYLTELQAPDGYYGDGLRLLDGWDYRQLADSGAAAYFSAVWRNVLELTFHDDLPEEQWPDGGGRWFEVVAALLDEPADPYWDNAGTENTVETRDMVLVQAARDARDDMTREQGKDPAGWNWGRLHAFTLTEPSFGTSGIRLVEWLFNRGPVEVGGGSSIVQATSWDAAESYETTAVPSMRMVVDLGDLDSSTWIDLTGISGHPRHDHYGDQTTMWRAGQTLPMRWSESSVRDAGTHTLTLRPRDAAR